MTLRLRISPCPNDTFMFDALLNGRIDTGGLHFDVEYRDIEALNRGVQAGEADVSTMAVEYAPNVTKMYNAANCEALGLTMPEDYVAIEG